MLRRNLYGIRGFHSHHGAGGKEWTPLAPGEVEHKYYAPRVGLVFIEELKGKTVEVELVDVY